MQWLAFPLGCALAGCPSDAAGPGDGGTSLPPGLTLKADPFMPSGLATPVFLAQPLNDGRIFVVEKAGRIRGITNGLLQATPILDISTKVLSAATVRGMFSVAFHPQYATGDVFYVYYTTQANGTTRANGDIVIERFTATANPEVAVPPSVQPLITRPHSAYVHP